MAPQLPTYEGYTVDARLRQFRRVPEHGVIEFIDFESEAGDVLLGGFIETLDLENPENLLLVEQLLD